MIINTFTYLFLFSGFLFAPLLSESIREEKKESYAELLARAKSMDPGVDFQALRFAYSDQTMESEIDSELRGSMLSAYQEKNYTVAKNYAEKILQLNFLDIQAHEIMKLIFIITADPEKEKFHRYMADSLVRSILDSRKGRSDGAYVVISIAEEYAVLDYLGLQCKQQDLIEIEGNQGHKYNQLEVVNPKSNLTYHLLFNIDRLWKKIEKK